MLEEIKIPFVDLHAQYLTIKSDIDDAIRDVIKTSSFIRGPYVESFENLFSKVMGSDYCISCANGTDSLYIAMRALGLSQGDEVIAPAHSWISTTETITQAGGKVVFCDTDLDTFTLEPNCIEEKITNRTVGIIPVHLYGQSADMDPILKIAKKYKLWILEDCAQAHLAKYKGRLVGSFGHVSSFSFYPGKNLGAMGDAGSLLTNSQELAKKMAMIARHGGLNKGSHLIEGINSRMDGLQAAILSVKLPHLKGWTEARQRIAKYYSDSLVGTKGLVLPKTRPDSEHVFHLYVIRHRRRDELAKYLALQGIETVVNYPVALPFLPAYSYLGHCKEEFPNAYQNQSQILSIPIFPELHEVQMKKVVKSIKDFCSEC